MGYSSQQFPQEMLRFTVTNLHAQNLKRSLFFSPDPYVKMSVQPGPGEGVLLLPHHGQVLRTAAAESTVNPRWTRLQFEFIAYPSDVLEFEIKDKFSRPRPLMSRFLGKLRVSIQELVAQCGANHVAELSYPLLSRNPSDQPISGNLLFSFFLETVGAVDPWLHIRQVHNPVLAEASQSCSTGGSLSTTSSSTSLSGHNNPPPPPAPESPPKRSTSLAHRQQQQPLRRGISQTQSFENRIGGDAVSTMTTASTAADLAVVTATATKAATSSPCGLSEEAEDGETSSNSIEGSGASEEGSSEVTDRIGTDEATGTCARPAEDDPHPPPLPPKQKNVHKPLER